MKLNKQICEMCYKKAEISWDKTDEELWRNDKVWCVEKLKLLEIQKTNINSIPDSCPYKLEHIVIREPKNNET